MPAVKSLTFKCYTLLILIIILLGKIMPSCSRYAEKKLLYIIIAAPSSRQPSSYFKCTKVNMQLSYNIHSMFNIEYTLFILYSSVSHS